jgi:hypothetical protein
VSYEYRSNKDYFFGTLLNATAISDTSLSSAAFTGLDADYSSATPGKYIPLELHDPAQGLYEIVWVVGHAAGSQSITVVRGREGTPARAWNAGTQVVCAPTAGRDALGASASNNLPSDPHIGQRVARTNRQDVVERGNGVWGPSVGAGIAADQGVNMHGTAVPDGAVLLFRCGTAGPSTDAQGGLPCVFKTPFPNGCLSIAAHSTFFNAYGQLVLSAVRPSGADIFFLRPDGSRLASATASYTYMAIGW